MPTRIGVAIRVRPPLENEKQKNLTCEKLKVKHKSKQIQIQLDDKTTKTYQFDQVLDESSTQVDLFEKNSIDQLIQKVIEGYHSTIFAYGQTGSGKTFSMEGFDYEQTTTNDSNKKQVLKPILNFDNNNDQQGIIPRTIQRLFEKVKTANSKNERVYKIYISYLQIYNEKIYDLLNTDQFKKNDGPGLRLRWNKKEQFQVENLFVFECSSVQETYDMLSKGIKNKVMASHKLNTQSSRSHCILTLKVESMSKVDLDHIISAKLHLVDLAGSERQSQTGTEGQNFKECIEINKSLFTLRQVINALAEQSIQSQSQENGGNIVKQNHVPYRDSKLTSLLKQSIGGNSYCLMIACLSPCDLYQEENISTLNYATKASQIANDPVKNEDPKNMLITELKSKVEELTKDLARANEHISFLSKFSTENMNKYGSDILKLQKTKSVVVQSLKGIDEEQEDIQPKQLTSQENIKTNQNRLETPKKENKEDNPNHSNLQSSIKKSLNKMGSELSIDGGLMSSDMIIRRLVESANMVRDLLQSNINMREMIEKLTKINESVESEVNILQIENSDLREKIEIMENIFQNDMDNEEAEKGKFDYKKVLEEQESNLRSDTKKNETSFYNNNSNNKTFTSDFGYQTITRQEIVNEIHQLRKEKKHLSSRLKSLEIENNELHTKLNPNQLYGEPTRMHLNQTMDMFTYNTQPQNKQPAINYKPTQTKLKKSSLGSRGSAKIQMNAIEELSPPSQSQNQYTSLLSTQQQFSSLFQSKLNYNPNNSNNNNNLSVNQFNNTMYYNNIRKQNSTAVNESPDAFPPQIRSQQQSQQQQQQQSQFYTRTSSSSKHDNSFSQPSRLPPTGNKNIQNQSYNAGDVANSENYIHEHPQYSNFARNTPCFNQPSNKLYETSSQQGWVNANQVMYPNHQTNPMNQTQYNITSSQGSGGGNGGNFSNSSKSKNLRALSQNSKRPNVVRQHLNLPKNF